MADIVLRDRNGNPLNFYGAEYLDVLSPDGSELPYAVYDPETLTPENLVDGVKVGDVVGTMTVPDVVENVPIALDFTGGNQTITAPDGALVKSAIIQKPDNLRPANIAEGVDIAGIIGTLVSGGGGNPKVATGTFYGNGGTKNVVHNLGVTPDFVLVVCQAILQNHLYFAYALGENLVPLLDSSMQSKFAGLGVMPKSNGMSRYSNIITNIGANSFDVGSSTVPTYKSYSYDYCVIAGLT